MKQFGNTISKARYHDVIIKNLPGSVQTVHIAGDTEPAYRYKHIDNRKIVFQHKYQRTGFIFDPVRNLVTWYWYTKEGDEDTIKYYLNLKTVFVGDLLQGSQKLSYLFRKFFGEHKVKKAKKLTYQSYGRCEKLLKCKEFRYLFAMEDTGQRILVSNTEDKNKLLVFDQEGNAEMISDKFVRDSSKGWGSRFLGTILSIPFGLMFDFTLIVCVPLGLALHFGFGFKGVVAAIYRSFGTLVHDEKGWMEKVHKNLYDFQLL